MADLLAGLGNMMGASKRLLRGLLVLGGNRVELLAAELAEERDRLLTTLLLAAAVGVFGLLAMVSVSAALAVVLWPFSPVGALLVVAAVHALVALLATRRFLARSRGWLTLPATRDQLRKDRECLEKLIS